MRKYFFVLITLAFASQVNAQSNLVFNQVLNFVVTTSSSVTVPEGKVWKIERSNYNLRADKQGVDYGIGLNNAEYFGTGTANALWFAEGTTITADSNETSLSILEFNLVDASTGSGGGSGTTTSTNDFNNPGGGTSWGDDYTPGESVTDIDGNVYETVTIGPQTWTTSNLNVSKYRDGTPIPHITSYEEWATTPIGAYTYVLQDESGIYKKLYNLYAVIGKNDLDPNTPFKKLAPEGFHIPTKFEWQALIDFYGGSESASDFLRSENGWENDLNGNNQSGLNILPGGYINTVQDPNQNGFLQFDQSILSVSQYGTSTIRDMYSNKSVYISHGSISVGDGFYLLPGSQTGVYIRLVKN